MHTLEQILVGSNTQPPTPHLAAHKLSVFLEHAVIFLARGAGVMLTSNLWQEVGLCNGATGVVEDLLFHPDRPPPCLPIATLVHFSHYKGPDFYQQTLRLSPYHPIYLNGKVMVRYFPDSSCHCDCDMP